MPTHEHALVVGKFAPLHRGHQLVLDRASASASRLTVILWSNPDFVDMPNEVRAKWVRELYPQATVLVGDNAPRNDAPDRVHWQYVASMLADRGLAPDVVLTSESYGAGFAHHLGAAHIAVDEPRSERPVSGSAIRADVHARRGDLDPRVYRHFVEKVVFLGAESTGKSTLAARMARELRTQFVAEYGRVHYEEHGGRLDLRDYVTIAERHRENEDEAALQAHRWLFVDTNAIATMFFSHYYDRDSLAALRLLADDCRTRYRHVIVCDDDIDFEQDGWRDNELWRARMQGMVLHDLAVRGIGYRVVSGSLDERVAQVKAILAGARGDPREPRRSRHSLGPQPPPGDVG
ncbi:MAG: AAA family ATPase [Acidimicrobiales bacterium]